MPIRCQHNLVTMTTMVARIPPKITTMIMMEFSINLIHVNEEIWAGKVQTSPIMTLMAVKMLQKILMMTTIMFRIPMIHVPKAI